MKRYLNLTGIFNNRRFYPDTYVALNAEDKVENVLREVHFLVGKPVQRDGAAFVFGKAEDGSDSVDCAGQRLAVDAPPCRRIRFAGFCTWGSYEEYFTLRLADGTERKERMGYLDWTWSTSDGVRNAMEMEGKRFAQQGRVFMECPALDGLTHNMYCYTAELDGPLKITEIVFPENEYMHIFAITLED